MAAIWTHPDWDAHEYVQVIHDRGSGLTAIIALHSTTLGPGAGGARFWHYADPEDGMRDALRLSRGMSYKNALAGLPMGGGKAVVLLDKRGTRSPAMLAAFGNAVDRLAGRYVTAEDVGASEADMVAIRKHTAHVCGLPAEQGGVGGDPGPWTARGVVAGIKAAVRHRLGRESLAGIHVAIQGCGAVGSGVARLLASDGARLTLADTNRNRAETLPARIGGLAVSADRVMDTPCDVFSPNALGAILDDQGIARLDCAIVAGGANNQLLRDCHGSQLASRGILYAPDYVINAGGIINVTLEYLARERGEHHSIDSLEQRIAQIPERLMQIWQKSEATGRGAHQIADEMARERIGRA